MTSLSALFGGIIFSALQSKNASWIAKRIEITQQPTPNHNGKANA